MPLKEKTDSRRKAMIQGRAGKAKVLSHRLKELSFLETMEESLEVLAGRLRDGNIQGSIAIVATIRAIGSILGAQNRLFQQQKRWKRELRSMKKIHSSRGYGRDGYVAIGKLLKEQDNLDRALEHFQKKLVTLTK